MALERAAGALIGSGGFCFGGALEWRYFLWVLRDPDAHTVGPARRVDD